ncbi:hypothetical protein T492DRAFT_859730, partial [Pavlovales sp. CCMP2436]
MDEALKQATRDASAAVERAAALRAHAECHALTGPPPNLRLLVIDDAAGFGFDGSGGGREEHDSPPRSMDTSGGGGSSGDEGGEPQRSVRAFFVVTHGGRLLGSCGALVVAALVFVAILAGNRTRGSERHPEPGVDDAPTLLRARNTPARFSSRRAGGSGGGDGGGSGSSLSDCAACAHGCELASLDQCCSRKRVKISLAVHRACDLAKDDSADGGAEAAAHVGGGGSLSASAGGAEGSRGFWRWLQMLRPGIKAAVADQELTDTVADTQPPPYTDGENTRADAAAASGYSGSDGGGYGSGGDEDSSRRSRFSGGGGYGTYGYGSGHGSYGGYGGTLPAHWLRAGAAAASASQAHGHLPQSHGQSGWLSTTPAAATSAATLRALQTLLSFTPPPPSSSEQPPTARPRPVASPIALASAASEFKLLAAWRIQHPSLWQQFDAAQRVLSYELAALRDMGFSQPRLTLATQLAAALPGALRTNSANELIAIAVVDYIEQIKNSRTASDDLNRDRALKALQILPAVMHEGVSRKIATVVGPQQVAVGVKSGISMSLFGATIHLGDDPEATTIKVDVQNAFGSIERSAVVELPTSTALPALGIVHGGVPIGDDNFIRLHLDDVWKKHTIDYWLQHVHPDHTLKLSQRMDALITELPSNDIAGIDIDAVPLGPERKQLPMRLGGLGLHARVQLRNAAYASTVAK